MSSGYELAYNLALKERGILRGREYAVVVFQDCTIHLAVYLTHLKPGVEVTILEVFNTFLY